MHHIEERAQTSLSVSKAVFPSHKHAAHIKLEDSAKIKSTVEAILGGAGTEYLSGLPAGSSIFTRRSGNAINISFNIGRDGDQPGHLGDSYNFTFDRDGKFVSCEHYDRFAGGEACGSAQAAGIFAEHVAPFLSVEHKARLNNKDYLNLDGVLGKSDRKKIRSVELRSEFEISRTPDGAIRAQQIYHDSDPQNGTRSGDRRMFMIIDKDGRLLASQIERNVHGQHAESRMGTGDARMFIQMLGAVVELEKQHLASRR